MATWNASYEKGKAYEINFCSAKYEEAKAVEKVCCAIMDKKVGTPDDVQIVRHGKWIAQDTSLTKFMCSECKSKNYGGHEKYCPFCGAKMDGE